MGFVVEQHKIRQNPLSTKANKIKKLCNLQEFQVIVQSFTSCFVCSGCNKGDMIIYLRPIEEHHHPCRNRVAGDVCELAKNPKAQRRDKNLTPPLYPWLLASLRMGWIEKVASQDEVSILETGYTFIAKFVYYFCHIDKDQPQ